MDRLPDAQKILAAALKKNPKDVEALLQRAELYMGARKYTEAEADINQVLHFRPESAEVHYTMAQLYQARGEVLRRRQELSEAVRLNQYLLPARLELAQLFVSSKTAAAALELLDRTPDSQKAAVLVQRNWVLWNLGDLKAMRTGIDQGFAGGRTPDLLIQDGLWKLSQGNPAGARAALEEALKINPGDLRALEALHRTYAPEKESAAALKKVKEYVAQQPKSAPAKEFLGLLLWANRDIPEARRAFAEAKAADPAFTGAEMSLVQLDAMEKKWDDAQKRLLAVVAADGGNARARLWLGNIEEYRGDHTAALAQFRKVVELDPDNPDALNNLAYLLNAYKGQPDEALKYAQRAQELAPDDPDAADTMGWILYQKGLYRAAIPPLERAASHNGNVVWKYHLAMAYAKSGDAVRGRAALQAGLNRNPNVPEAEMAKRLLEPSK
jgi:tetratricopeptide (TPR) repeat protein